MGINYGTVNLIKISEKHFYCESGQTLVEGAQKGCELFITGNIQNSAGHGSD